VDLRVSADRGGRGASLGTIKRTNDIADMCINNSCIEGSCDARKQCSHAWSPATIDIGPGAAGQECVYVYPGTDSIEVWVNDVNANDWDTTHPYAFTVELTQGCPAVCNEFTCAQ
jgi:hypothetical protein